MRRILLLFLTFFITINVFAQQYLLSGRITDAKNNIIPFTSVYIRNSTYGTSANEFGRYQFKLSPGEYNIMYRFVGYKEKTLRITITDHDEELNVQLQDEIYSLNEVVIKAKSKRSEDPGMAIMRQVVKKREFHLNQVKAYSCAVYIKGVQRLLKAPKKLLGKEVARVLDLDSNGRGILYQSESISEFNFERPDKVREITIASKVAGQNTAFSYNKASDLEVNLYENVFLINGLSSRGFVSPVADNAFNFYRYQLEGSTVVNGKTIDKIKIIPRRKYSQAFQGNIYIIHNDWKIYSADLLLTSKTDNLSLVDTLSISQQYIPVKDDVWMPVSAHFDFNGDVLGFKFAGYYIAVYNNYRLEPKFEPSFFNGEILRIDTAANKKDSTYWANARPVPLTRQEARDYVKKDSVFELKNTVAYKDSAQRQDNKFNPLDYVIFTYDAYDWRTKQTFTVEPLHRTIFYNTVEGYGIDLRVKYNKLYNDFRALEVQPTLHYGFASKMFSANVHANYTYDPLKRGMFYTSFGSDVLDLNNVGTRSLFFNTVSSLIYENNYVKYYRSRFGSVGYQRELSNGILWNMGLGYANRRQLYNISFNHIRDVKDQEYTSNNPLAPPTAPADDKSFLFPEHNALTFSTSVEFTFDQKYVKRPTGKIFMPSKYPKVLVSYRKGINNVFGSDVNYDFASVDVSQDDMTVGSYGHSAFKLTAGTFFNRRTLYFMDYNHFLGNVGTTFDPTYVGSFHFLPFYEFSTDRAFLEAHYFH
ncbi:MAG: carboxypeptidase-like regulatory domain-containing protein, partial [Sphingobacteriaceae bacterium]